MHASTKIVAVTPRCWDEFLLSCCDHSVEIFGFVLEYLDKLNHASIAYIKGTIELENARVTLGEAVKFRNILRTDQGQMCP